MGCSEELMRQSMFLALSYMLNELRSPGEMRILMQDIWRQYYFLSRHFVLTF